MKTTFKIKYFIGSLIFGAIIISSIIHANRYDIFIPIIFGTLFIFSISLLIVDKKI